MKVKNLVKKYDGKTVVDSVSFEIPKGKVTSLIGPNGAGKSTVMGIISRLIARDSGMVSFEDRDPVLRLTTVSDEGLVEAIRANAQTVGAIFGETEHVDELLAQYDAQIAALAEFAQGKTCVLGMSTSGSFNQIGRTSCRERV